MRISILLLLLITSSYIWADVVNGNQYNVDPSLNEYVTYVPANFPEGQFQIETTVYYPNTPAPWPLVVVNHGADGTLLTYHQQSRFRPIEIAKYFLSKGYVVVAPMREGFARSGGTIDGNFKNVFKCDHAAYGMFYARDISATIDFFEATGLALKGQTLVIGQSNGGIVALGYASTSNPKARGIINISGGVNTGAQECDWVAHMMTSATTLGHSAKIPSLWMYANDDQIFPPTVSKPFFDNYKTAGGMAQLQIFPSGGHPFALANGSASVWGNVVDTFLTQLNYPVAK